MTHTLSLPYGAVPEAIVCIAYVVILGLMVSNGIGFRRDLYRPALRFLIVSVLFWGVYAGWLQSPTSLDAVLWVRLFFPIALMLELAAVEVALMVASMTIPAWYVGLWLGSMAASVFVWVFGWTPILMRSPDGYFIRLQGLSWISIAILVLIYGAGVATVLGIFIVSGIRARSLKRYAPFIALAVFWGLLEWHDGIYALHHRTPYPLIWILGVVLGGIILYRGRVSGSVYNGPMKTLSPYEGWEYGREHLSRTSVGLLHASLHDYDEVRDLYGSVMGDQILSRLGEELVHVCRYADRVVQLATGQFILVFPTVTYAGQKVVRERVTEAIQQIQFHDPDSGQAVIVSIDWGWAWAERGANFDVLVNVARHAPPLPYHHLDVH